MYIERHEQKQLNEVLDSGLGEIDMIEGESGILRAYECKLNTKKMVRVPLAFSRMYPEHTFDVVSPNTFAEKMLV